MNQLREKRKELGLTQIQAANACGVSRRTYQSYEESSNFNDTYKSLYNKLKDKMNGRHMWFRNNVSTILCNCAENFAFSILAFIGTYPLGYCLEVAVAGSVIEMVISACDTPFLYLAKDYIGRTGILLEKENDEEQEDSSEVIA